ncbi:MAG TPA: hypothetical protein VHU41_03355 [Thermoanaerobaculia bacterium]|nr:hypothetical protein [Thermoanaerobaculia bacterium]
MNFGTYVLAATIHFVGIIAFMPQPSIRIGAPYTSRVVSSSEIEDHGARVASVGPPPRASVQPLTNGIFAVIPQDFPHLNPAIPAHTAMILYRTSDYVGSAGLNRVPVPRDGGLEYVVLNHGDMVTFNPGHGTNPTAAVPAALPHNPAHSVTNQLNMVSAYGANDRTHSTVVSIPAGTVSVCQDNGRSDTTVALNTTGSLVINIKGSVGTSTLTLKSSAELAILNVPLSYATSLTDNDPDMNHYLEYCVMAGVPTDAAHCPQPNYQTSAPVCAWHGKDMLVLRANAVAPSGRMGSVNKTEGAMADCSNTQWP